MPRAVSADADGIGREWSEREWESREPGKRLERWRQAEADALLLLMDVPDRAALAAAVIRAAEARWLELLGYELAGPECEP